MITYRFELRDDLGTITFGSDKVYNWAEIKPSIVRNKRYKGLYTSFTNTFKFVNDIGERFLDLYDKKGVKANAYLRIFVGNGNKERSSFKPLGFGQEYRGNFVEFKREGKLGISSLNFIDTSLQEKVLGREDIDVNYNTFTSLDGDTITPFTDETQTLTLHDRTIKWVNNLNLNNVYSLLVTAPTGNLHVPVPLKINYKSDDNFKDTPVLPATSWDAPELFFYLQSDIDRTVSFVFDIDFTLSVTPALGSPYTVFFYFRIVDEDFNTISSEIIDSHLYTFTDITHTYQFQESRDINILQGQSLELILSYVPQTAGFVSLTTIEDNNPSVQSLFATSLETFPATTADVILPHELFTRLLQVYTGVNVPFYSELFGRTELGYQEDGEWAYLTKATGLMIRGFPYGDYDQDGDTRSNVYNSSLRDEFEAYNSIINLAATIEVINGQPTFRIEKYDDIFDSSTILDFGSVLANPIRENNPDLLFTAIECGYKDQEYEEVNGLGSFNGEFHFATPHSFKDKKYKIVNKQRADDFGIEFARRQQYSLNPTGDTRYDEKLFFIHAKPSLVQGQLVAVKNENFSVVNNILNPDFVYNLEISPKRNLLRHSSIIKAGVLKVQDEYLTFAKGTKNSNLESQLTTETSLLVEKADILISDISSGKISAEMYSLDIPFTEDQWDELIYNQNKLCKFAYKGKDYFGFIDDFAYDINKGEAKVKLLRSR